MAPKKTTTTSGATGSDGTGGSGNPVPTDATPPAPNPTFATATAAGTMGGTTAATATGTPTSTSSTTSPTAGTTSQVSPKKFTPIIAKIIHLCDFPSKSTMVEYVDQQYMTMLRHVATINLDEVKDFFTV